MQSYPLIILMLLPISGFGLLLIPSTKARSLTALWVQVLCLLISFVGFLSVLHTGPYVLNIGPYEAPWGITLNIGPVEALLTTIFIAIAAAISLYGHLGHSSEIPAHRLSVYPTLYHMSLVAVLGILMTGDIFNSFVFLELSSLSACGIILISKNPDSLFSTLKYLILSSLGSGLVLMGIAYLYAITGHLNLHYIHMTLMPVLTKYPAITLISLGLFITGLGLKSAIFPLHIWLPDAYNSAPTPSVAFLSALTGKAPAILLIKLMYGVYGFEFLSGTPVLSILLLLGAIGMLAGSLLARKQTQLKPMIAYSSVAQMGYVFLGIGLGAPVGVALSVYHMIAHSLSKACLFLASGFFAEKTGRTAIKDFRGIGREMPYTLGIFTLCGLSMVGIPVLPGFISKFNLALASLQAGKPLLLLVILLSSLLNATYYFPVIINGYFGEENLRDTVAIRNDKSLRELAPLIILSTLMILTGFLAGPILNILQSGFYAG